jgi:NAD(P)H-hydrate repair Nnr-like enzyme with NAD(P)H-hydrate epimerase domain
MVAYQKKIFLPTGGRIVASQMDLPSMEPVDFIIDSLLGSCQTLLELSNETEKHLVCQLIVWANGNRAPLLSIDIPSGINTNTGILLKKNRLIL